MQRERVTITISGNPKPKSRPRFNRGGRTYTDQQQKAHEKTLSTLMRAECSTPLIGDLSVTAQFFRSNKIRVDIDNLVKTILDSANKILFNDDSQVKELYATIDIDKNNPRTIIIIERRRQP